MFCNFELFFTLTLFFSIHKNKFSKREGRGAEAPSVPPGFYRPVNVSIDNILMSEAETNQKLRAN